MVSLGNGIAMKKGITNGNIIETSFKTTFWSNIAEYLIYQDLDNTSLL